MRARAIARALAAARRPGALSAILWTLLSLPLIAPSLGLA
jgi:hypothetical protein